MASNPADSEAGNATVIAPSSKIPSATLTVLKGEGFTPSNKSAPVMPLPFVIGRSEGALIIVDSNISRRHAQITYDDMQHAYYLTDMNSSNGTQLNNHRLIPGQPVRLSGGSVIDLGPNVTLRFDLS
jgi:predicted component of type VI protein secretion system